MSTIKKAYREIVQFLEDNSDSQVADVLEQIIELASAKTASGGGRASVFVRNTNSAVIAIKCYYHKLWMDPRVVEFGKKANSVTGLSSLCKDGVQKWTKQQRDSKQAQATLLTRVADGEVLPENIAEEQEVIRQAQVAIHPRKDGYGFDTLDACLEDSAQRGLDVIRTEDVVELEIED